MISDEQKAAIKSVIQESVTSRYFGAYTAGIGANIHLGEKKARAAARAAGCTAMKHGEEDLSRDGDEFAAACQMSFDAIMNRIIPRMEQAPANLIVPARLAQNGNGKLVH
jgi:hypothetical protein